MGMAKEGDRSETDVDGDSDGSGHMRYMMNTAKYPGSGLSVEIKPLLLPV